MRADPKANTRGLPTLSALASPLNGIVEIAGPDQFRLDELIHKALRARNDLRDVTTGQHASYFGIVPSERALLPGYGARIAETRFADWLSCSTAQQQPAPSVRGA
jgi:outer membrane protein TolC